MKKLIALLLVLFLMFALVACGGDEPEEVSVEPEVTEEIEAVEDEPEEEEEPDEETEEAEEEIEEGGPEAVNENAVIGPATAAKGNMSFDLPAGWSYEESDSTISAIQAEGALVFLQGPLARSTEDLSGDLTVSMETLLMSAAISGLTDATQNEQRFAVNDMQYPAVTQIYSAQIGGQWLSAHAILFFGEEEAFIVHMFDVDSADDFFEAVYFPFLQSIRID